jgi:hypothetical protein
LAGLLALIFTAFGTTIVVERALKLSLLGLLSVLGYACARRFSSPLAAATSVALGLGARFDPVLLSSDTALVAILAALLATMVALEAGSPSMKRIDWILLWDSPSGGPVERRQASGATALDAYLASRYESVARYGPWEIRRRSPKSWERPDSSVRGRNPKSRVSSP